MLVISSREFRQHQAEYFERVDNGEQVIVQRGKNKGYALTLVQSNDLFLNSEMIKKLDQSLLEIKYGESKTINSSQEIKDLLGL